VNHGAITVGIRESGSLFNPKIKRSPTKYVDYSNINPEVARKINDIRISEVREVCTKLNRICSYFPTMRFIGWDVVVYEDRIVLLEGNARPGINNPQIHGPLKKGREKYFEL